MNRYFFHRLLIVTALALSLLAAPSVRADEPDVDAAYLDAIRKTEQMTFDSEAQRLAERHGLQIMNVTWEDTGRYSGSSVGPNISDVTIQVQHTLPGRDDYGLALMPVIRHPNFSDLTADISPDDFFLMVGNERGGELRRISLREYLGDFRSYLSDGDSWAGRETSLLAERDSHVLVSAQAAFLPIPQAGTAEFNPVIFNYQSYAGDPAVLTIVATREGTSATVIDNTRDAFPAGWSWGQRLFFNQSGERASFTGQRLSDFNASGGPAASGGPSAGGEAGLNMVLLIQVPLKQKQPMLPEPAQEGLVYSAPSAAGSAAPSDVEAAVIGHGAVEGPFTEIDGLEIERDDRFPVRVTVQFYKATSNGVVSAADLEDIAAQIDRVYADADYVGSLVVDGPAGRPTEYDGSKIEPDNWWPAFWSRFEANTGLDRQAALRIILALKMSAGDTMERVR
ncbi:MAG TPA: hypothetical protein VD886_03570 [Herpetosiphonaceae bacterium]|nr:hypothetical protein [Herpetosiphonaceae bacterium]